MFALIASIIAALVTGVVRDAVSEDPIPSASVAFLDRGELILADGDGVFEIDIPTRPYAVVISAPGYRTERLLNVMMDPAEPLEFRLYPKVDETATGGPADDGGTSAEPDSSWLFRDLEGVAVTATRVETKVSETPREVHIVDTGAIADAQPRGTPEALDEVPEVLIQKTNLGGGAPIIRGLSGNRILLMVDGVRLNNSTYRIGLNQYLNTVDSGIVDRVEVVPGAGSALYGSDALGGVVQVFTLAPSETHPSISYSGHVTAAEGSTGQTLRLHRWWGDGGALVTGSYRDLNDFRGGGDIGIQRPTAFTEWSGSGRWRQKVGERNEIQIGYQITRQSDVPRTDRIVTGQDSLYVFDPQQRELAFATMSFRSRSSFITNARVTGSWNHQREGRRIIGSGSDTREELLDDTQTLGLAAEATSFVDEKTILVYGADVYTDAVDSDGKERNLDTGAVEIIDGKFPDDGEHLSAGIFVQAERQLNPSLTTIGALRFSTFHMTGTPQGPEGYVEIDNSVVTGSLQGRVRIGDGDFAFLGLSQGFRSPSMEDALSTGLSSKGWDVPNPALDPERTVNVEAGLKIGGFLDPDEWLSGGPRKQITTSATLFATFVDDLIERTPTTFMGSDSLDGEPVFHNENLGKARLLGGTAQISLRFHPKWTLRTAAAYTYGENTDLDVPLTRIPPLRGRVALRRDVSTSAWIEAFGLWATEQSRLSPDDERDLRIPDGGTPGYAVFGVRGGYDVGAGLVVRLSAENLLDEAYRVHGSGIDMPGRNLRVGIDWSGL